MSGAREIAVWAAAGAADVERVRVLMRGYGTYLAANPAGAASICIPGYDEELALLPEPYAAPGGLLLATVDGEAAGCAGLKPLRLPREDTAAHAAAGGGDALELKRLWAGPRFRGLGLGRLLMQAALDWARDAGAAAVYLDTVPAAMPEANRLYEAFGFERTGRYNDNPVADVVFFRRWLQGARSG